MSRKVKMILKNCLLGGAIVLLGSMVGAAAQDAAPAAEQPVIMQNVAMLEKEEQRPPAPEPAKREPVADLGAEQEKILGLTHIDMGRLARRFENAALAGDSITEAIEEYRLLDSSRIFARIGLSVRKADTLLERLEAARPATVFLCFGLNDIQLYGDNTARFIKDYTAFLSALREALPEAEICICAVPTMNEKGAKAVPEYIYRDHYNAALRQLCKEEGLLFADGGFILEQDPTLYDQDGIHPKRAFYPRWLTFLADQAGLPDE